MSTPLYTQEQFDIALLKEKSDITSQTLKRIELDLHNVNNKIDSNNKWNLVLIFGLYAFGISTLLTVLIKIWH